MGGSSKLRLDDAINRLQRYTAEGGRDAKAVEIQEEEIFQQIQDRERAEQERRCPSLKSIPRFYHRRSSVSPVDESKALRARVEREARQQLLRRKSSEELLDEGDLHAILNHLKENSRNGGDWCLGPSSPAAPHMGNPELGVMDYAGFVRIREELAKHGERFKQLFSATTFLKFPRDKNGCIPIVPFITFAVRKVNIKRTRLELANYDSVGSGYLREKDMENFIFELIPTLPQLHSLQEEFYPFYVFTAVRKFFFFLDPKRTGRVRVRDLLSSQILPELYELRQEAPLGAREAEANWFSMQSALKVYGAYLELDGDQNGMLSKSELIRYGSGMLTEEFINRIFEEYHTYRDAETGEREMDYKTFLDFVLAMENKNSKQAIQYFWKLIDIHHAGFIDGLVINYFFRAVMQVLQDKKIDVASVDDVKDEIFDMVKSEQPGRITLQDLVSCRQGGVILSMLIDAAAFWRYDHRESLLMEPPSEEDML